ncbi:MAG: DNA mismatch repair endonuclease MutL [Bacillota bacterium]
MGNIIVLDENTANKIAAGEVVERPASIVKELVENSIDAGATNISIDIKGGGILYIKITDNGTGIAADDAIVAFERHATSKIQHADDLFSINTLGFRGEALASIAAVSNVELTTRTKDSEAGTFVKISGGKLVEHTNKGCPIGTTIIIRDLFFNTPARYKFLKKDTTEATYVADMLSRIALARTDISFKLTGAFANRNEVFHTPGNNDLRSAVYNVFGREYSLKTREVMFEKDGIVVSGVAGTPDIAKSNRNSQIVFLNHRYIKSKIVSAAADEAYKTFLMKNKFPFFVLNIQMSPMLFDVNVHPSKMDVRFSNEGQIFSVVYHAINNAIQARQEIRAPFEAPKETLRETPTEIVRESPLTYAENPVYEVPLTFESKPVEYVQPVLEKYDFKVWPIIEGLDDLKDSEYAGQIFNTYLLFQRAETLYLIDQHAAHERIKFEELVEKHSHHQVISQELLVPRVIELSADELAIFNENTEVFSELGFEIESFGGNTLAVRHTPLGVEGSKIDEAINELITRLKRSNTVQNDEMLYIIACKTAIKGNQRITSKDAENLRKNLLDMKNPLSCPHGRPTVLKVDRRDFEKLFKRII